MSMLEHLGLERDFRSFGEEYSRVRRALLLNPNDKRIQRDAQKVARAFRRAQKEFARSLVRLSSLPRGKNMTPSEAIQHSVLMENTAEYCELLQVPLSTVLEALGVRA
ncbi:MAG: hypothetical protein U0790_06330 [Isosphaeraceae bacterium]